MNSRGRIILFPCVAVALLSAASTCRREPEQQTEIKPPSPARNPRELLVFPDELRVEDASVNAFITRAMETCAAREYDAFRLLWSVRQDPLPREEFEEGWQAVEEIRIKAVRPATLAPDPQREMPDPQSVYAVVAEVMLDPKHPAAKGRPRRHVVLMLVQEQGDWRLAHAPKPMRDWIKKQTGIQDEDDGPSGASPATAAPERT